MAFDEAALLVTEDKDFGELVFAHQMAKITVVFLRYRLAELPIITQNLLRVINDYGSKEGRFFIVILHAVKFSASQIRASGQTFREHFIVEKYMIYRPTLTIRFVCVP